MNVVLMWRGGGGGGGRGCRHAFFLFEIVFKYVMIKPQEQTEIGPARQEEEKTRHLQQLLRLSSETRHTGLY